MSISAVRPLPTTASRPTSPLKSQTSKAKQTSLETLSDSLASNLNESPSRPPSAYINRLKNTELLHGNSSKSLNDEAEAERTVVYSSNTNLSTVLGSIVNVEMKLGEKKTSPAVPGITYSMPFLYFDKRDSTSATNNRPPSAGRGSLSRGGSAGTNSSGTSSVRIPSASFENIGGGGSLSVSEAMDQGMLLIQKASSTTRNSSGGKKSIQTRATPSPASIEWQLQKSKSEQTQSQLPSALEAANDIIDAGIYTQQAALPSSSSIEPISSADATVIYPNFVGYH
ncbi:hypothetical protein BDR26DRAFT_894696 [Obelidium mucronatum]|nr:hypothetical protein BDR26DRAFT_894696 [Obelidium mucronatum]